MWAVRFSDAHDHALQFAYDANGPDLLTQLGFKLVFYSLIVKASIL